MTVISGTVDVTRDWGTASRESAGLAPDPVETREAVIQVYAARASGWRGAFAVHSWIAVKPTDAPAYTIYQMFDWRGHAHHGLPTSVAGTDVPDRYWYGNRPELLVELRGDGVNQVIQRIEEAVRAYPYVDQYRMWPGPNSNTFTAFIGRRVPELELNLPSTAIGKDYLADGSFFARSPSASSGNRPELLVELRGDGVNQVIQRIEEAVRAYPYVDQYRMWPGPNSNTFTAFIGRRVPELELNLPSTAIGKDYLADGSFFARSPSGTGYQISLLGLLGVLVGRLEGLEVNVLSLTIGIDPLAPALKLPGLGRIGPARR